MRKQLLTSLLALFACPAMVSATVIRVAFSADAYTIGSADWALNGAHVEFEGLLEAGPVAPSNPSGEQGVRLFKSASFTISNKPGANGVHYGARAIVTNDAQPDRYFWPSDWLVIDGGINVPGSQALGYTIWLEALDGWPTLAIPERPFRFEARGGMPVLNYYILPYQYEFLNLVVTYEGVPEPGTALALSAAGVLLLRRRAGRGLMGRRLEPNGQTAARE